MARERLMIEVALAALEDFSGPTGLTERIGAIERAFAGGDRDSIRQLLDRERIAETALAGVLDLKRLVGQINVVGVWCGMRLTAAGRVSSRRRDLAFRSARSSRMNKALRLEACFQLV